MISTFGERVKALRMEKGMTQVQLAEAMDTTKGSVSAWERNLRTPSKAGVEKLCQLFGVSRYYIMGYDESRLVSPLDDMDPSTEALVDRAMEIKELALKLSKLDAVTWIHAEAVINALYAQAKLNNKLTNFQIDVDVQPIVEHEYCPEL